MNIVVSAAEISSDIHAAALLKPLIQKLKEQGHEVKCYGIGGPHLRALPEFHCLERAENLRTMGIGEVIARYFELKKILNRFTQQVIELQPNLLITFDYPDFHFRLLKKVSPFLTSTLKICAIPPKVWVWRKSRLQTIKKYYHGVWVLFPFEEKIYEKLDLPVIYEGNPLVEELGLGLKQDLSLLGLKSSEWESDEKIALFPGSRASEVKHHLRFMLKVMARYAHESKQPVLGLVSVPKGLDVNEWQSQIDLHTHPRLKVKVIVGQSSLVLRSCKKGLIKSGTATLEATLLGCFPVIFYKTGFLTEWFFRIFIMKFWNYQGPVGLPNIILRTKNRKESFFPEFLGPEATEENLLKSLKEADFKIQSGEAKSVMNKIYHALTPRADGVMEFVAQKIIELMKSGIQKKIETTSEAASSVFNLRVLALSLVWSMVNGIRRRLSRKPSRPSKYQVKKILLVGNLQAGGAGKTPLIIEIAKYALKQQKKVLIGSRGYQSKLEHQGTWVRPGQAYSVQELGDEVALMRQKLPDATFLVGAKRGKLLNQLSELHESYDLLIWDDGYQNFSLPYDDSILCVTQRRFSEVVYRDFPIEARYAHEIIQTKGQYPYLFYDVPHFTLEYETLELPPKPIYLLCAVADPHEVASYFRQKGVAILGVVTKPDHAEFLKPEVKKLIEVSNQNNALVAVTEKDWVKIEALLSLEEQKNVYVLRRSIKLPEAKLKQWIEPIT